MEMAGGQGRKTRSQLGSTSETDPDQDQESASFRLAFLESLDDSQVATKLTQLLTAVNKNIVDSISGLQAEIRTLKDKVAERDATIEKLQREVRQLRLQTDALEQYGRRSSLRITGISEDQEDTSKAVVDLANEVLELDPPLQEQDIDVSHRLNKPRNTPEGEPRPIIIRFMTRTDCYRVISERKTLKKYNEDNRKKIYINEDLTTYRARLFKTTRSLQARKYFKQAWTYNGNIKVTTQNGVVKPISTIDDIKSFFARCRSAWFDLNDNYLCIFQYLRICHLTMYYIQ